MLDNLQNILFKITIIYNVFKIIQLYNDYSSLTEISTKQFFFVKKENNKVIILNAESTIKSEPNDNLKDFDLNSFYFAFADSSTNEYAGWPLRNYLLFLLYYW